MTDIEQSLEQLLSKASPRPVPKAADAALVRAEVHAEWQAVIGQRRTKNRMIGFAVAASVALSVFLALSVFRVPDVAAARVASIQKSFGSIYVLGEQSKLTPADDLKTIHSGQVIVTGSDAGMALAWAGGGSVRLDKDSEVEFRDEGTVYLKSGQIYFDSQPSNLVAGVSTGDTAAFEIETDYGAVTHVGTQFMAQVGSGELKVSVREGFVGIAGNYHDIQAQRGEQITLTGRQRPSVMNISEYGATWAWVADTSPPISVDGRSAYEFLHWAGRELGREVVFTSIAVEQEAKASRLHGEIHTTPAEALSLRMATTDIDWSYQKGAIYVGTVD